jgi:hypothetical protein
MRASPPIRSLLASLRMMSTAPVIPVFPQTISKPLAEIQTGRWRVTDNPMSLSLPRLES